MSTITLNLPLLRRRIEELYGTQAAFARRCGWSRQYVSRVLSGQSAMSMARLGELAAALGLSVNQVLQPEEAGTLVAETSTNEGMTAALRERAAEYEAMLAGEEPFATASTPGVADIATASTWEPAQPFASEEERIAFVRSLRGKYRDILSSTDEIMRRKHEEMEREESGWAIHS